MGLLRDRSGDLRAAGVELYAISRDSPWTHIAWQQALDLDFALLSDWNGEAVRAFDNAQRFREFDDVALRSAFVIDRDGVVRFARAYANDEVPDVDELVEAAQSL
jgi:glutaredoxin-dependent peroxiredoxin